MTPLPDNRPEAEPDRFGRRESLIRAGGLAIVVLGAGAVPAAAAPSSSNADEVACVLAFSAVRNSESTTEIRTKDVVMITIDGANDSTVSSATSWTTRSVRPAPVPRLTFNA